MTPKNPSCSDTGRTVRNGCKAAPAERSRSAPAIVGIKSSIRKSFRTSASLRIIGECCIGVISVILDRLIQFVIPSAAEESLTILPRKSQRSVDSENRADTHDQVAHQVIGTDHLAASLRFAITDDEGFA